MTSAQRREPETHAAHGSTPLDAIAAWDARLEAAADITSVAGDLLVTFARAADAARGSLMMVNPLTGRLRIVAAQDLPGSLVGQDLVPAPRRISDWVLRERLGVILNGHVSNQRFEGVAPRDQIASAMSVPLLGRRGAIGVLNLSRATPAPVFTAQDLAALEGMAPSLAALLESVHELEMAGASWRDAKQRSRARAGADEAWNGTRHWHVALARIESRLFAGDVFEHVSHPDGGLTLMLADVFGRGCEALRIGDLTRGLFLAHARERRSPAEIVARIHECLIGHDPGSRASLWVACHSPVGQMVTCNAGYPPALSLSTDGVAGGKLGEGGPPAGVAPGPYSYEEDRLRLLPGDTIVVMSDGLLDARSAHGAAYDIGHVEDLLHENRRRPLEQIVRRLCEDALAFGGIAEPVDDMVALAIRFSREG